MAIKDAHGGAPWYDWPAELRRREREYVWLWRDAVAAYQIRPVPVLPPVARSAPACPRDRASSSSATCRSSSPRTPPTCGPTPASICSTRPPAERRGRRAARLFQQDRPALGQPALRLGRDAQDRVRVVGRPPAGDAGAGRRGSPRPLPRVPGRVAGAGRRGDGRSSASGCRARPRTSSPA